MWIKAMDDSVYSPNDKTIRVTEDGWHHYPEQKLIKSHELILVLQYFAL